MTTATVTVVRTAESSGKWKVLVQQYDETFFRLFHYKTDAEELAADLDGKTLLQILDTYGSTYLTQSPHM